MSDRERGETTGLAWAWARRLGCRRVWVVRASLRELACAVAGGEAPTLVEPLTTSPVTCRDLRALAQAARREGRPFVADVSACGPLACAAARLGAHVALAALPGGLAVACASRDAEAALPGLGARLDDVCAQDPEVPAQAAEALLRKDAWWHEASDEAQVVASYLRCHPRVEAVSYPGLRGDASFEVAARTLQGGFGPFVDYRLTGGPAPEPWQRVSCEGHDPRMTVCALERALAREGDLP